jgi:hypothetical protein
MPVAESWKEEKKKKKESERTKNVALGVAARLHMH